MRKLTKSAALFALLSPSLRPDGGWFLMVRGYCLARPLSSLSSSSTHHELRYFRRLANGLSPTDSIGGTVRQAAPWCMLMMSKNRRQGGGSVDRSAANNHPTTHAKARPITQEIVSSTTGRTRVVVDAVKPGTTAALLSSELERRKRTGVDNKSGNTGSAVHLSRNVASTSRFETIDVTQKSMSTSFLRDEMLQHDLLSPEEEMELGDRVQLAASLKERMDSLIDEKKLEEQTQLWERVGNIAYRDDEMTEHQFLTECNDVRTRMRRNWSWTGESEFDHDLKAANGGMAIVGMEECLLAARRNKEEYDLSLLTEKDIIETLGIPGGSVELSSILRRGAHARRVLTERNLKLVVSIAKRWIRQHAKLSSSNANTGSSVFYGAWDLPSLDEVVQEGVVGLSRAVDKYDPSKGIRFSTYATHWITSYVRVCLREALTNCLKIPQALHDIRKSYAKIMREAYLTGVPMPTDEEAARDIGVTPVRLRHALAATQTLLSIDGPLYSANAASTKGGSAGGGDTARQPLLVSDVLQDSETTPEEFVDRSFLRQCLENAIAAELSPHERDVIRLRLGLDDGYSRTAREVVDVCGGAISMADVRTAERRAYKKLRSPNALHTYNLLSFLDVSVTDIDLSSYNNRARFDEQLK